MPVPLVLANDLNQVRQMFDEPLFNCGDEERQPLPGPILEGMPVDIQHFHMVLHITQHLSFRRYSCNICRSNPVQESVQQLEKQTGGVVGNSEESRRQLEQRLEEMGRETREMSQLHLQQPVQESVQQLEKQTGGVVGNSEESRRQLEQRLEEMGRETREMSQLHLQQPVQESVQQLEKQTGGVVGNSEESRRQLEQRLEEMGRETREMSQLHLQQPVQESVQQLEKQTGGVVGNSEESRRHLEQRLEEMGRETREMSQLHLQQMSTSLQNQVEQSMEAVAKQISAKTTEALKSTMKEELSGLTAQLSNASLRSNAATPAAPTGPEAEKIALQRKLALQVQQKDLNGAFQTALNACDLEILTFLLSKLEPKALFAKSPFPLSTPVLLSLLHQLAAADLRKDTELKLKYLDEALSALDESAPDVQKYLPKITGDLTTRIKEFKESKPAMSNPLGRLLRKIEASCQSF